MKPFQRYSYVFLFIAAILIPFVVTFIRLPFGLAGWGTMIYAVFYLPVLLIALLILAALVTRRKDPSTGKTVLGQTDSILLSSLYGSLVLHSIFLVDGGDTQESTNSIASALLGSWFQDVSSIISGFFSIIAALLIIGCFIVFISERSKKQLP